MVTLFQFRFAMIE